MNRALLIKELRECLPIAALGVLAAIYALLVHTGWALFGQQYQVQAYGYNRTIPFVGDEFTTTLNLIGGGLAIALGLKQTVWEDFRGTFRFLFYRPASLRRVIAIKLLLGLSFVLLIPGFLILAYTAWAATPGNHSSPFYLSMTIESWKTWMALPLFYLTAFLSGLRPARWYGTRLAPLMTGFVAAMILAHSSWWGVTLLGTPLVAVVFIACIANVARTRDY